jgi:predicted phage-related endonuclease
MIPDLHRIRKDPEWHSQRMKGIGGSDWAAILSDHFPNDYKWSCMRRLFYEKKGVKPDFQEKTSRAAVRGNILEPVVAELFQAHTGCTFTREIPRAKELYPGQKIPEWWIGNPDYIAVMPGGKLEGLECKTMNQNVWFDFIQKGLSTSYQIQPQHYIGLTGLDLFHVAVMWPDGLEYQTEPVSRSEEMLRLMVDAGEYFIGRVLKEEKAPAHPPVSEQRCAGCMYARRCLGQSYWEQHEASLADLSRDDELYHLLSQIESLKAEKRSAEKALDQVEELAQAHILRNHGEDVEQFFCREFETKWLKAMGTRFQKEELLADDPSLAARFSEYTKSFPRRTFSLSITKKSTMRWETMRVAAG